MKTRLNTRLLLRGIKIDDRTSEYISKKLAGLGRILPKILMIEVEVDLDKKGRFRAEVMIRTPRALYRAEDTTQSVEGSIDSVIEQLKTQIKKDKEKRITLRWRGGRSLKKKMTLDSSSRF